MAGIYWVWETWYEREAGDRPGFRCHNRTAWIRPTLPPRTSIKAGGILRANDWGHQKTTKANWMWGLTPEREGEPIHGSPIFTSFYPQGICWLPEQRTAHNQGQQLGTRAIWLHCRDRGWSCKLPRLGRDLRGSQRNEPQILPAIFPQLLGCTKIKGKHKNQVGNGSEVVNLSRLQQWFWEPKAGGQGLPGERV